MHVSCCQRFVLLTVATCRYDIDVCELKANNRPVDAVSIIEADINVDFDAPVLQLRQFAVHGSEC